MRQCISLSQMTYAAPVVMNWESTAAKYREYISLFSGFNGSNAIYEALVEMTADCIEDHLVEPYKQIWRVSTPEARVRKDL